MDTTTPTAEELELASRLLRFMQASQQTDVSDCRHIVVFLSEGLCRNSAQWKNAVLFHLTGMAAVCTYRDI